MRLFPPHVLRIYVRNRSLEGMTGAQIADWLRAELRWDKLEPETMDDFGKRRYLEVEGMLRELETGDCSH